eukprot:gene2167-2486_t
MFFQGLQHKDNKHIPNAVARFGDDSQETLFATLHDIDAIFDTHQQLEELKPKEKQGEAFVLFANSDIGKMVERTHAQPPKDYMKAFWGRCPPVQCQRARSFDFRGFCSTKDGKEDPALEQEDNVEWNEMRAVFTHDNMVGLMYIHDPAFAPTEHVEVVKKLLDNFGDKYELVVFKLREAGGSQGDLLVAMDDEDNQQPEGGNKLGTDTDDGQHVVPADAGGQEMAAAAAAEDARGTADLQDNQQAAMCDAPGKTCRLLSFWEYLKQYEQHQQEQEQKQEQAEEQKQVQKQVQKQEQDEQEPQGKRQKLEGLQSGNA